MTLDECITILTEHNKWRRGADTPMSDAIDYAIETIKAPRTISREEFALVVDDIGYHMARSTVRGSKAESAAHSVLKILGITVGD